MILKAIRATCGETLKVENQWAAECEALDTTICRCAWTYGGQALSGGSVAGTKASVTFAPTGYYGCLKNTVVLANGETLIADRAVLVN
jgi:hypothetical protein